VFKTIISGNVCFQKLALITKKKILTNPRNCIFYKLYNGEKKKNCRFLPLKINK
jgi:hypothetical protein